MTQVKGLIDQKPQVPEKSLLDLLRDEFVPDAEGSDHSYNAAVRNCIAAIQRALKTSQGVMAFAIDVGRPLIRQSFPGPDAHKLTVNEYAYQLGVCTIGIELDLIETIELESIDSHLPKVRFDAPFDEEKP